MAVLDRDLEPREPRGCAQCTSAPLVRGRLALPGTCIGVFVRGAPVASLGLQPQPELLRTWNLANLDASLDAMGRGRSARRACRVRCCTIATGAVISKEAALDSAREVFGPSGIG